MSAPRILPPATGDGAPAAPAPAVAALEPRAILARPEAAIAPFASIAALAIAFLTGQLLYGELPAVQAAFAGGTIVVAAAAIAVAALRRRRETEPRRTADPRIHAVAAVVITLLFVGGAASGRGLASPYLSALVLGSGYLGLVLPRRMSAVLVAFMTASLVPLAFVGPPVTWLEAATLFALVPGGRSFGVLCGSAHRRAERVARQLTRADRLTHTLSRAGFLEELDDALVTMRRAHAPVALYLVDLDGFKEVNGARGGAAGDELLAWCGQRLAELLPRASSAGRLGGDEFGIAIAGMERPDAERFAIELRDALGERHPVSIGVATSEDSTVTVSDLLRVGNAALQRAKRDGERRIHALVAGGLRPDANAARPAPPVLTYERLRRNGGRPEQPSANVLMGSFISLGLAGLGILGGLLAAGLVITGVGEPSPWLSALTVLWVPWTVLCFVTAWFARDVDPMNTRAVTVIVLLATLLVGGGIGVAALAQGGGLLEPVMAGLALRVLFDTSVAFAPQARITLLGTLAFFAAVVLLGPASALWAAPLHLVLILSAYAIGRTTQRGFIESTEQWLAIAQTDVLTGLDNRLGIERKIGDLLERTSASAGRIAVLSVDIDGMRAYNDAHGHPAGDLAIQRMASTLGTTFSAAEIIGRLGADEFFVAVPVLDASDADRLTATIESVLRDDLPVSAGVAVFPDHGRDLDGLLHIADVRRRSTKAAHREAIARGRSA